MNNQMIKLVAALLICFNICFAEPPASQYKRQCVVNDVTYNEGDPVPSGDSCNTCICTADGVTCTEIACPAEKCTQNGEEYSVGDFVPSQSYLSCEVCTCTETGIKCSFQPFCFIRPEICEYKAIDDGDPCTCPECAECRLENGTFAIGKEIPTGNVCEFCNCDEIRSLNCIHIDCAPPPDGCVFARNPKECCEYVCEKCTLMDGREYAIGDEVPSPLGNVCETCSCTIGGIKCNTTSCKPPPKGCKFSIKPVKCCDFICEQTTTPPTCNEYYPDCPQGQGPTVREAVLVAAREDFHSTVYGP